MLSAFGNKGFLYVILNKVRGWVSCKENRSMISFKAAVKEENDDITVIKSLVFSTVSISLCDLQDPRTNSQ